MIEYEIMERKPERIIDAIAEFSDSLNDFVNTDKDILELVEYAKEHITRIKSFVCDKRNVALRFNGFRREEYELDITNFNYNLVLGNPYQNEESSAQLAYIVMNRGEVEFYFSDVEKFFNILKTKIVQGLEELKGEALAQEMEVIYRKIRGLESIAATIIGLINDARCGENGDKLRGFLKSALDCAQEMIEELKLEIKGRI